MSGIKWSGVKILNSPLSGNIYIGKLDKSGRFATDKSEDRTIEILTATMNHMDFGLPKDASGAKSEAQDGTLYWVRKGYSVTINKDTDNIGGTK